MVAGNGKEVQQETLFSTANYKEIGSSGNAFSDALKLAQEAFGADLVSAEDLGDGFSVADKATLVGVPMVSLAVMIRSGDLGQYVVCRNVTKDNRKVVIVDGSTGLKDQLVEYMEGNGGMWPQLWPHGLRKSEYTFHDSASGNDIPATTFYLDTSA